MTQQARVTLWLAACALAARAQGHVSPECPQYSSCEFLEYKEELNLDIFHVNGFELQIVAIEGSVLLMDCEDVDIDDDSWPRFPRPVLFTKISLLNCAPPGTTSYATALKNLNVNITEGLDISISILPEDIVLTKLAFSGFPTLSQFSLMTVDGWLNVQPSALSAIDAKSVTLKRVRADQLPTGVDTLRMLNTEMQYLPDDALKVSFLELQEKNLQSISGSTPRLKTLKLYTPELLTLTLVNAPAQLLRDGLLENCLSLQTLILDYLDTTTLPSELLWVKKGISKLIYFQFTNGNITTLPPTFFSYSSRLEDINLRSNMLEYLPSEVFSGLANLHNLLLDDNRLSASDLRAFQPLVALTLLSLNGNPLGDVCPDGNSTLPSLPKLKQLFLIGTGLSQVCAAWQLDLPSIHRLELSNNVISSFSCADFHIADSERGHVYIDLRNNLVEVRECGRLPGVRHDGNKQIIKTDLAQYLLQLR